METQETRSKLANAIRDLQSKGDTATIDRLVSAYKTKYQSGISQKTTETVETPEPSKVKGGIVGEILTGSAQRFGKTIGESLAAPKNAELYAESLKSHSDIQNKLQNAIQEKKKIGGDTSKLENALKQHIESTPKLEDFTGDVINKTAGQVLGEAGGTALEILPFGTFGKATKAMKTGELATKATIKLPTVLESAKGIIKKPANIFSKKTAISVAEGAGLGYGIDVTQGLQGNRGEERTGASSLIPGFGTAIGATAPLAIAGVGKVAGTIRGGFARRATTKADELSMLKKGVTDSRVVTKTLKSGKIITDKPAKEAIRQGIPEADVALIKGGSVSDKLKMSKMLNIRESQLTNKRVTARATDIVGDTFINNIAKPIEKLNRQAGQKLNVVAQKLAGKKVNTISAVEKFANELQGKGITVTKGNKLNFKGSDFEGLKGAQTLIQNVWNRAIKVAKSGDALQVHRTKSFIDEIVNYGKEAEGLSGRAQTMLKSFRHALDEILDIEFPVYNKVNTQFAETIQQLNNIGAALGKSFRLGDTFADAKSGVALRRILSNTSSRAEILRLLDGMQQVAKKYGIKIDDDIITQANFADVLEKILGSEAPTSFLGQFEKGLESFGSSGGYGGIQQAGSAAGEFVRGNVIRGGLKTVGLAVDAFRGISQKNKINALRELLKVGKKGFTSR